MAKYYNMVGDILIFSKILVLIDQGNKIIEKWLYSERIKPLLKCISKILTANLLNFLL